MRKGYALIEIMFVIFIFGLIIASMDRFFRVIAMEIPKDNRLVQENVSILSAVRFIKNDVSESQRVSENLNPDSKPSLVIQKKDGLIFYDFNDGKIIRANQKGTPEEITWSLPHSKLEMHVWQKNSKGYAVELITYIEDKDLGHNRKKMANNYVFFAGVSQEAMK